MIKDNPNCVCWKTYTCLLCEDIASGRKFITDEGVIKRIVRVSTPRTYTPRVVAQCGTRAGYNKHRREGEPACAECKAAQNEAVKDFNKRKRAS